MKKGALLLYLLLICKFLDAQEQAYSVNWTSEQADSVKKQLRVTGNDTLRMKMARSLGLYHQEINRDTSLFYTNMQMALAKQLKQKYWETDAYEAGGWLLSQVKNYPLSIEYLLTGLRMASDESTEKNIWQLDFFSPDKNTRYVRLTTLGFVHNDLSQLYHQTGDVENEFAQIRIGIAIANQIGNDILLALLKSNLAQAYLTINKLDSVIYYGKQALEHMKKSGYKTYEGYQLTLLGDAYIEKGDFATAKTYLDESIKANEESRTIVKLPDTYFSFATMYQLQGRPDSSIVYLNKAVSSFRLFNLPEKIKRTYLALYKIYQRGNLPDSAYHYLQLYQSISDSLNDREKEQIHASQNFAFNKQIEQQQLESRRVEKANANRTFALLAGIVLLILIAFLLFRNNTSRRKVNARLQKQNTEIEAQRAKVETTLSELKATQAQLIQSEKMASLGELTAGIAHEIQNPLNFVNNFSEVSHELIDEMNTELDKGDIDEAKVISSDIKQNLEKINHHGKRADAIVKGMLQHSQSSTGKKEPTDINKLADEYLRLAYHGLRAKDNSFNATIKTDFDGSLPIIKVIPQDIGRVVLNLLTNAFYAANEKRKQSSSFEPIVTVSTRKIADAIQIRISDNGNGIPSNIIDKIFQPFFTTKPTGQGTGLGLSLSYDIVTKGHGGELKVETKEGGGTAFIIQVKVS